MNGGYLCNNKEEEALETDDHQPLPPGFKIPKPIRAPPCRCPVGQEVDLQVENGCKCKPIAMRPMKKPMRSMPKIRMNIKYESVKKRILSASAAKTHKQGVWCGPSDGLITSKAACQNAAAAAGIKFVSLAGSEWHAGCIVHNGGAYFVGARLLLLYHLDLLGP